MGTHWSFSGQTAAIDNWALLAPLLALHLGCSPDISLWLLAFPVAAFIAISCAADLVDLSAITPQAPVLSRQAVLAYTVVNMVVPWALAHIFASHAAAQLQDYRQLQESVDTAEALAQMIVDFDLDTFGSQTDANMHGMVALLHQVGTKLKLYRPYIPAHLLPQFGLVNPGASRAEDHPVSNCSFVPTQAQLGHSFALPPDLPIVAHVGVVPADGRARSNSHNLRSPLRMFQVAPEIRCGTLLYIRLPQLESFSRLVLQGHGVDHIHRAVAQVTHVIATVLQQTGGVIQVMQQSVYLASWNFISACPLHSVNACHAAVLIRDRLAALDPNDGIGPLRAVLGVWAGTLLSGTFGTDDTKSSGAIGRGITRVRELQCYGAMHQRGIIANSEVRRLTALNANIKLLPVDVLSIRTNNSIEPRDPSDRYESELVYEVLGENSVQDDEWMYQLQTLAATGRSERDLERLLRQAQEGARGLPTFCQELTELTKCPNAAVAKVAIHLQLLHSRGHLRTPYRLEYHQAWTPVASPEPPEWQGSKEPSLASTSHLSADGVPWGLKASSPNTPLHALGGQLSFRTLPPRPSNIVAGLPGNAVQTCGDFRQHRFQRRFADSSFSSSSLGFSPHGGKEGNLQLAVPMENPLVPPAQYNPHIAAQGLHDLLQSWGIPKASSMEFSPSPSS
eukprot:EG_transcript_2165